jgi:Glycosyltransferase family 87
MVAHMKVPEREEASGSEGSTQTRYRKRRTVLILAPLLTLLLIWSGLLVAAGAFKGGPGSRAFGEDFNVYLSAAHILRSGGNPYDRNLVYRTETSLLHSQGLKVYEPRKLVRVGNPPLFFWILGPLTAIPFRLAVLFWVLLMYALAAAGMIGILIHFGWRHRVLPLIVLLSMPMVVHGSLYGEVTSVYFAALGVSLALSRRYPFVSGVVLSLAWLKPPIALPLALLIMLFHTSSTVRAAAGFALTSALGLILTLVTVGGGSLIQWERSLVAFSQDIAAQPGVVSLSGLYMNWTNSPARIALEAIAVAAALILTYMYWRQKRPVYGPHGAAVWLWPIWLLATPYAHYPDEMVLAIPVVALLEPNGMSIGYRIQAAILYLLGLSLWFTPWSVNGVQTAPLIPLLFLLCIALAARRSERAVQPLAA